jgi:2-oxoglutarate dehydrogenase complex dehydrogenase (E1) component-like enzyme
LYADKLVEENVLTRVDVEAITQKHMDYLTQELMNIESYQVEQSYFKDQWTGFQQAPNQITVWDTGLDYSLLQFIGQSSVHFPEDFVSIEKSSSRPLRLQVLCSLLEHPSALGEDARQKSVEAPKGRHEH